VLSPVQTADDAEDALPFVGSLTGQVVGDRHARAHDVIVLEGADRDLLT